MAADGKPCADLLHQIAAIQAALRSVAQVVMEDHLDHCVLDAVGRAPEEARELIDSLKNALGSYMR